MTLSETIFNDRYVNYPGESRSEASLRLSSTVAKTESDFLYWRDQFNKQIAGNYYMPAGRIWRNAGRPIQMMLNCFVTPAHDSREGWGEAVKNNIIIAGTGGGNGENYSEIRPKGSHIRGTGGIATGPVSLMRVENAALTEIKDGGGRRAARMGCLNLDHPDIIDFIKAKADLGQLNNFNVSVVFNKDPEEFFKKVRNNEDWEFVFKGQVHSTIKASELWNMIVGYALSNGEPGLLNGYLANKMSNLQTTRPLIATNPCVTGDTVILTVDGPRTFEELAQTEKDVLVYAWHPETKKPVVRWMRRPHKTRFNTKILEVEFDSGLKVRCTPDHNFYSFRGTKVKAQDLKLGSSVRAFSLSKHRDGHLRVHGWNTEENKVDHQWVHRMVWETYNGPVPQDKIIHHLNENPEDNRIENLACISPLEHNSEHYSERILNGFHHPKEDHNHAVSRVTNHKVVAIREAGFSDVYNGCVDDAHTYIILDPQAIAGKYSGIVSANCGEIWLQEYGVCCLGSLVLSNFVKKYRNPDQEYDWAKVRTKIDWDALKEAVWTGVRFLDDVLDTTHYPLPSIKEESMACRRIGLGTMGLHYFLLKLGLKYSSEEGRDVIDRTWDFIKCQAYLASIELAKEKGAYPLFNRDVIVKSAFFKTLPPSIRLAILEHGLRNCAILDIPPTGTTSIVAQDIHLPIGGVSSGIEPIFAAAYERRFYKPSGEKASEVVTDPLYADFVRRGFDVSHFEDAADIDPEDHIKMQIVCQKHIDNSVSKTINLPQGMYSIETLGHLFMTYLPQLKGITIYPENSREDSPLKRLDKEEAKKLISQSIQEVTENDCPSGVCSI